MEFRILHVTYETWFTTSHSALSHKFTLYLAHRKFITYSLSVSVLRERFKLPSSARRLLRLAIRLI